MKAKSAIILTDYRTGGTFLSLALDSHPMIYCARAEPLSKTSPWWDHIGNAPDILDICFRQECSKVNIVKVVYRQAGAEIWDLLEARKARIIHLVRKNELRAACSFLFHKQVRAGQVARAHRKLHTYIPVQKRKLMPRPMRLEPDELYQLMRRRVKTKEAKIQIAQERGLDICTITYEGMVGGEGASPSRVSKPVAKKACMFLGVSNRALRSTTRKVNAYPLSDLVSNWPEIVKALEKSEFSQFLEVEVE